MKEGYFNYCEKLKKDSNLKKIRNEKITATKKLNHGGVCPATFKNRKHTEETKELMSVKAKLRVGDKNSQFGTCWVYNEELKQNKKINKNDIIPNGWRLGRKIKYG